MMQKKGIAMLNNVSVRLIKVNGITAAKIGLLFLCYE